MNVKLGEFIFTEDGGSRDAVHIAIIPIEAGEDLAPGTHVGLVDGKASTQAEYKVGVVDPFLMHKAWKGTRFYLCLFPGTVTSLRHEWTHPMFPPEGAKEHVMSDSEVWLRAYAMSMNTYDEPNEAFSRLVDGLRTGRLFANGTDLHGYYELSRAEELQHHAEVYLGMKINLEGFSFSCSC